MPDIDKHPEHVEEAPKDEQLDNTELDHELDEVSGGGVAQSPEESTNGNCVC